MITAAAAPEVTEVVWSEESSTYVTDAGLWHITALAEVINVIP